MYIFERGNTEMVLLVILRVGYRLSEDESGMDTLSRMTKLLLPPSENGSTLNGKNLLQCQKNF